MFALALLAVTGWLTAGVMIGLYLGERGRRRDAQRREGVIVVDPIQRPEVGVPAATPAALPEAVTADLADARERYILQAVAEGYDPDEAGADFDKMVAKAGGDAGLVPWRDL